MQSASGEGAVCPEQFAEVLPISTYNRFFEMRSTLI